MTASPVEELPVRAKEPERPVTNEHSDRRAQEEGSSSKPVHLSGCCNCNNEIE